MQACATKELLKTDKNGTVQFDRLASGNLHLKEDLVRAASSPADAAAAPAESETLRHCEETLRGRTVVIDVAHAATALQVHICSLSHDAIQNTTPRFAICRTGLVVHADLEHTLNCCSCIQLSCPSHRQQQPQDAHTGAGV